MGSYLFGGYMNNDAYQLSTKFEKLLYRGIIGVRDQVNIFIYKYKII
jgi:hypothetical protein